MALKGGWIDSWRRRRLSMATSPDGCVLSPGFDAVSLYAPVAGEHGLEGAVAPCPALLVPGRQLVGHCVNRVLN